MRLSMSMRMKPEAGAGAEDAQEADHEYVA